MLKSAGEKNVVLADLTREDSSLALGEAFRFDRMVLCASSYDGGVFLPMENFLVKLSAKTYQNRKVALVENGTWAPSAAKKMTEYLKTMKNIHIFDNQVTIKSSLNQQNREELERLAEDLLHA